MKSFQIILRQRKFHNFKYQNTVLPSDIYDSRYHSSCYRSFTALKKNCFETSENVVPSETQSPVRSECSLNEQPKTSTSISLIDDTPMQELTVESVQ